MELKAPLESITSVIFTWFSYQGIFFVPLLLPEQLFSLLNPTGRYIISVVQWNLVLLSFLFLSWCSYMYLQVCFGDWALPGQFTSILYLLPKHQLGVWFGGYPSLVAMDILLYSQSLMCLAAHSPGHQHSTSLFYCSSQYSESDLIHTDI